MKTTSRSAKFTRTFAFRLSRKFLKKRTADAKHALIIGLKGDLGAGKTTFIQGFAKGLGVKKRVVSPTFLIFRPYKLKTKNYRLFYHIDAYRLKKPEELAALGFKKIITNPKIIAIAEWAEKIKPLLPQKTVWVNLSHGKKPNERIINLKSSR